MNTTPSPNEHNAESLETSGAQRPSRRNVPRTSVLLTLVSILTLVSVAWVVLRQTEAASEFTQQVEARLTQAWQALRTPVDVPASGSLPSYPAKQRLVLERPAFTEALQLVEAIELQLTSQRLTRTFTGILNATQSSDLGFNRTGQVDRVFVDQGEQVNQGDVLIQLDTVQLEADISVLEAQRRVEQARLEELIAGPRKQTIDAARAKLKEMEALRDQAKTTAERQAKLWKENAIARQSVDDSVQQLAASQNRVIAQQQAIEELEAGTRKEQLSAQRSLLEQLDAEIASVRVKLDESKILAPFDGIVSSRKVDQGAIVLPGTIVLSLVKTGEAEAWVGLPLDSMKLLDSMTTYRLKTDDQIWMGRFRTALPELEQSTRSQTVIFDLWQENETPISKSPTVFGQLIRLEMPVYEQKGMWVPQTALTQDSAGVWSLFTLADEGEGVQRIKRTSVEIERIDSEQVLISGEVRVGDKIVVRGLQKLTPNQLVLSTLVDNGT